MITDFIGARPGCVVITTSDGALIIPPARARQLATLLPRLADCAEQLELTQTPAPLPPSLEGRGAGGVRSELTIAAMAAALIAAGWKWYPLVSNRHRGFWGYFDQTIRRFFKTPTTTYPSATTHAHALETRL